MSVLITATGRRIEAGAPRPEDIDLTDIAIGLARQRRFSGQTKQPYNVAQHSCLVAEIVAKGFAAALEDKQRFRGPHSPDEYVKCAFLHDASEAYIGDIIHPLKVLLPDYAKIEAKWMRAIAERFNLTYDLFHCRSVKNADHNCFKAEVYYLCNDEEDYGFEAQSFEGDVMQLLRDCPILKQVTIPWDETFSSSQFLQLARHLSLK